MPGCRPWRMCSPSWPGTPRDGVRARTRLGRRGRPRRGTRQDRGRAVQSGHASWAIASLPRQYFGREAKRSPAHRGSLAASPRPHHPGDGELSQPCVPPGAEGADAAGEGDVLDVAGADVRRGRAARPRLLPGAGPSHLPRDGGEWHHQRGGVPLPAPPARRDAVRRPQRHGPRARRGRAAGRPEDPAARHLLPQQRVRRPAAGRAATVQRRHRRRLGGPRAGDDRCRRRDPLGQSRPRRPAPHGRRGSQWQTSPRPPLRADQGERRLRRRVRRHPHAAARRPRRARTADQRRARHPSHRRRHRSSGLHAGPTPASAPPPSATSATASARAGRFTSAAARSPWAPTAMP